MLRLWQLTVRPHHRAFLSSQLISAEDTFYSVMGNLREPLVLQRDFCAVKMDAAVQRRWLLGSNPRFLTYTAGGNF